MSQPTSLEGQTTITSTVPSMPPPPSEGDLGMGNMRTDLVAQVLGGLSKGLELAVGFEQKASKLLAAVPWPAWPALRVGDMLVGAPHPHLPFGPLPPFGPVARFLPLPQFGFLMPVPYGISGAATVLINERLAARCGDMAVCLPTCLGLMPFAEMILGSATVWLEGQRAGRCFDLSLQCSLFDAPLFLSPGVGIYPGSGDVKIGGVPMPSLVDLAVGKLLDTAFSGLRSAFRKVKPPSPRPPRGLPVSQVEFSKTYWRRNKDFVDVYASDLMRVRFFDFLSKGGKLEFDSTSGTFIQKGARPPRIAIGKDDIVTSALAHELGHWADNTPAPDPRHFHGDSNLGRERFIQAYTRHALLGEGAAALAEFDVYKELDRVHPDPPPANVHGDPTAIYEQYRGSGRPPYPESARAAMGNVYGEFNPSTNPDIDYVEFYSRQGGKIFDDYAKQQGKLVPSP